MDSQKDRHPAAIGLRDFYLLVSDTGKIVGAWSTWADAIEATERYLDRFANLSWERTSHHHWEGDSGLWFELVHAREVEA